jgi:hypothetical protein
MKQLPELFLAHAGADRAVAMVLLRARNADAVAEEGL